MALEKEVQIQDKQFPELPSTETLSEEQINREVDKLIRSPIYGRVFSQYNSFMDYMLENHITTYKFLRTLEFPHS